MDLRLPAKILAMTALGLAMAADASADRSFYTERGLAVAAVPGAGSYEWRREPDGVTVATSGPTVRVIAPWRVAVTYQVRALPPAGSTQPASPWSDPSEVARWTPDPRTESRTRVYAKDIAVAASLFGSYGCAGEWQSVECSCTEGGPCPPP